MIRLRLKRTIPFLLIAFFIGLLWLMPSCHQSNAKKNDPTRGAISISGAFALYPLTVMWIQEFNKTYPDIRIDVSAGGAGKGMADVLADMVDLAMFSREVLPIETQKGAWQIAVAKDAVVAVINDKNPFASEIYANGFTREELILLYTSNKPLKWQDILPVDNTEDFMHVYTRSDACGAAQVWAKYLGVNQENLNGIGVFGDPGIADAVKKDLLGFGYNNIAYVYDIKNLGVRAGLEIVPIDKNGNGIIDEEEDFYGSLDALLAAIQDGRYPSPPARELYFVSNGIPKSEQVKTFLNWVLTDGQRYIAQAGYVQLTESQISEQLQNLQNASH